MILGHHDTKVDGRKLVLRFQRNDRTVVVAAAAVTDGGSRPRSRRPRKYVLGAGRGREGGRTVATGSVGAFLAAVTAEAVVTALDQGAATVAAAAIMAIAMIVHIAKTSGIGWRPPLDPTASCIF